MKVFKDENIQLDQKYGNKVEAILAAGEILVKNGYVAESYLQDMLAREEEVSTYIGNNIAIPHGIVKSVGKIYSSGISLLQVPEGVDFDGNTAYLVFGIAGKNNEHLEILGQIATICSEMENVEILRQATSKTEILKIFEEVVV